MKTSTRLYKAARVTNDVEVILSGDPKRIARRAKNKLMARLLGRLGFWRILWR